jgi:hypothetical protein
MGAYIVFCERLLNLIARALADGGIDPLAKREALIRDLHIEIDRDKDSLFRVTVARSATEWSRSVLSGRVAAKKPSEIRSIVEGRLICLAIIKPAASVFRRDPVIRGHRTRIAIAAVAHVAIIQRARLARPGMGQNDCSPTVDDLPQRGASVTGRVDAGDCRSGMSRDDDNA